MLTIQRYAIVLSAAAAMGVLAGGVSAQCGPTWNTPIGNPGVTVNGGVVNAMVTLPDGSVIIGGTFSSINGQAIRDIVRYTPSTGVFSQLGSGVGGPVTALAVVPPGVTNAGDVIVGGNFFSAGGLTVSRVARYRPSTNTWFAIPQGLGGDVWAIAVYPAGVQGAGDIVFGGDFGVAGGLSGVWNLARYSQANNSWATLGAGNNAGATGDVFAMAVVPAGLPGAGELIVGGNFLYAGSSGATNTRALARYRLSTDSWLSPASGVNATLGTAVRAISILPGTVSPNGEVIVGGTFSNVGNGALAASNIARYTLSSNAWSTMGAGTSAAVKAMTLSPAGDVLVAGDFNQAGAVSNVRGVARFTFATTAWNSVGGTGPVSAAGNTINAVAALAGGDVAVGGNFTAVDGAVANDLARYFAGTGPTITAQPVNRSVCVGVTTSFSVTATGSNVTYRWRRNGTPIDAAINPSAATATLSLSNVQAGDVGSYDCVVTSGCSVTSAAASLSVSAATAITTQPVNRTVCVGDATSLSVAASGGNLTYQWRFNGTPISTASNPSAGTATLSLTNVQPTNQGSYSVVVSGLCGASVTSSTVTLTTLAATTITQQPTSVAACPGGTATFSVTATGTGTLTYRWFKGGVAINLATNPSAGTPTLTLSNVQSGDAGTYQCQVSGTCGTRVSVLVTLSVGGPWCCVGDLNTDGVVNVNDFFAYLSAFSANDPRANVDGNAIVDINDFFSYLNRYSQGC